MAITNSIGATKKHIELVVMDRDFIAEQDTLKQQGYNAEATHALYRKYGFTADDLRGIFVYGEIFIPAFEYKTHFPQGQLTYDEKHDKFVAIFEPGISKDDLDRVWNATKILRRQLGMSEMRRGRIRSSKQDRSVLMYAVFKLRRDGVKWDQIFSTYEQGLLRYNGEMIAPVDAITSKPELQKAYDRLYKAKLKIHT